MNRKTLADTLSSLHAQYDDARDRIEQAREELAALDSESSSLSVTLSQMDLDRRALLREVTALELDLAEVRRAAGDGAAGAGCGGYGGT